MYRPQPPAKTIQLSGFILAETGKAMKFEVQMVEDRDIALCNQKQIWLPLSQVTKILRQPPNAQEQDVIHVSAWIWGQKIQDSWDGEDPSRMADSEETLGDPDEYDQYVDEEEGPPW